MDGITDFNGGEMVGHSDYGLGNNSSVSGVSADNVSVTSMGSSASSGLDFNDTGGVAASPFGESMRKSPNPGSRLGGVDLPGFGCDIGPYDNMSICSGASSGLGIAHSGAVSVLGRGVRGRSVYSLEAVELLEVRGVVHGDEDNVSMHSGVSSGINPHSVAPSTVGGGMRGYRDSRIVDAHYQTISESGYAATGMPVVPYGDHEVGSKKATILVALCVLFVILLWAIYIALMVVAKDGAQYSNLMLASSTMIPMITVIFVVLVAVYVLREVKSKRNSAIIRLTNERDSLKSELTELARENIRLKNEIKGLKEIVKKSSKLPNSNPNDDAMVRAREENFSLRAMVGDLTGEKEKCYEIIGRAVGLMREGKVDEAEEILKY